MAVLREPGDEVQGEKLLCFYRKSGSEGIVQLTGGHRGRRIMLHGLPGRDIVERACEFIG